MKRLQRGQDGDPDRIVIGRSNSKYTCKQATAEMENPQRGQPSTIKEDKTTQDLLHSNIF